jgi:quinol monooxygenase YgiN
VIFIAAKMRVLPQYVDQWPQIVEEFTRSTRAEPGCPLVRMVPQPRRPE